MPKFIDITNQKFGRLTVTSLHCKAIRGIQKTLWNCQCVCGKLIKVRSDSLINGHTQSCGCLCKEINSALAIKRWTTHGRSKSKIFKVWYNMNRRCNDPKYSQYKWYGGRGIKVCKRWSKLKNFIADMGEIPTPKHSIDRINVNGHYKPSNCRWATRQEQANNTRTNIFIKFNNQTKTVSQWARETGINPATLRARIVNLHWPVEKALTP